MKTLKEFSPMVEIYSIDEAYLRLDGFEIDTLQEYGKHIAKTVKRNILSIGIAPTKTLAKVASKFCKQYPKLEGCCFMYRPADIEKVLKKFPIDDACGIGRRYTKMLKSHGVDTAEPFRQLQPEWVKAKMSVVGLRTWKELHGEACIEFENTPPQKQSITVSRSFAKEIREFEPLHEALSTFVSMAAEKLRKHGSVATQMQVYILTNRHREDIPQHREGLLVNFKFQRIAL